MKCFNVHSSMENSIKKEGSIITEEEEEGEPPAKRRREEGTIESDTKQCKNEKKVMIEVS